jgi:hypothetical protein
MTPIRLRLLQTAGLGATGIRVPGRGSCELNAEGFETRIIRGRCDCGFALERRTSGLGLLRVIQLPASPLFPSSFERSCKAQKTQYNYDPQQHKRNHVLTLLPPSRPPSKGHDACQIGSPSTAHITHGLRRYGRVPGASDETHCCLCKTCWRKFLAHCDEGAQWPKIAHIDSYNF